MVLSCRRGAHSAKRICSGKGPKKEPKWNQNACQIRPKAATDPQGEARGGLRHLSVRFESGPVSEKEGPQNDSKNGPLKNINFEVFRDFMCKARQSARILSGS